MQAELLNRPATAAPGLAIEEARRFTPEMVRFLETIQWGSQGVIYTLKDLGATLRKLPPPLVFLLRKREKLIATHMVLEKSSPYREYLLKTLYISMLAVDALEQGKGYGKIIAGHAQIRQNELLDQPGLMYAYIEAANVPSNRVFNGLGFNQIGEFHATMYGRLSPKESPRMSRLPLDQESVVCDLLNERYSEHVLTDFDTSLSASEYWVLKDREGIVAGVQVDLQRWEIQTIPGVGGFIAQQLLPRLPVLKNLFNPRDFQFLKLGNIYFRSGHAAAAFELFESLLANYRVSAAMMYWDKRSPVYRELAAAGRFGLLNTLAETPVNVLGRFQGFRRSEIADFCQHPLAISPIDV